MLRRAFLGLTLLLPALALGADPPKGSHGYELSQTFQAEIDRGGAKRKIGGGMAIDYSLRRKGDELALLIDRLALTTIDEGVEKTITLSADKVSTQVAGKEPVEKKRDDLDAAEARMLACFGTPLAHLVLNENGREKKRTLSSDPAAAFLIKNNVLANARLFHPWFPPNETRWDAPCEMPLADGKRTKGELHYEKLKPARPDAKPTLVRVKVSGTLSYDEKGEKGGRAVEARYEVSGEQTYDTRIHDWASGTLTMKMSVRATEPGKPVETLTGTSTIKLKERALKD